MMLVSQRALDLMLVDLSAAADACAELVARYRDAIEPGRTLLQQALPLTFGLKAAVWLDGIDGGVAELASVRGPRARDPVRGRRGDAWRASAIAGWTSRASWLASSGCWRRRVPWHTVRLRPVRHRRRVAALRSESWARSGATSCCWLRPRWPRSSRAAARAAAAPRRCRTSAIRSARSGLVACAQRGPGAGRDDARGDGAGARARRWDVAGRMGDASRALLRLTGSSAAILEELLAGSRGRP